MGSCVYEAVREFNKRSLLGKVTVNPPNRVAADHITLYKTQDIWYFCKCGRAFQDNSAFLEHKETHPTDFFVDWKSIKYKQQLDYEEETIMHKCMHCGKILGSAIALRNHIYIHSGEKPWSCDKCNAVFRLYSTLYDHKKVSHVKGGQYKCSDCSCQFAASLGLKRHRGIYHAKVNLDAITMNTTNTASTEALKPTKGRVTVTVVTSDGVKTYPCGYCGKVFYKSQYLRNHYPVHTNERKNKCHLCGAGFKSSSNLLSHKKVSHVENGKFRCERCTCAFASLLGLVRHRRLLHNIGKSGVITQTLKRVKQLKVPVKAPVNRRPRVVPKQPEYDDDDDENDGEENDNDEENQNNNEQDEGEEDGHFECKQCGKVLASAFGLKNHELIHSGQKPWACAKCPATFRLNSTLHGHKKTSHVPGGQYKCTKCPCVFAAKFGLRRHVICFHGTVDLPKLTKCKAVPNKIAHHLPNHPVKVHGTVPLVKSAHHLPLVKPTVTAIYKNTKGGKVKVLKCPHCGIFFRNLTLLNRHILTHKDSSSQDRPFKCPYNCGCTYISRRSLRKHEKTAHVGGGLECPECTCSFATSQALKSHHTKRHAQAGFSKSTSQNDGDDDYDDGGNVENDEEEEMMDDDNNEYDNNEMEGDENEESASVHEGGDQGPPYICPTCGKKFSNKPNYRQHLRVHSGQRYDCDLCHEAFTLQSNMIRHKRSCHVINGPFKCPDCTHCYATTKGFKRHFAQAHGKFKGKVRKNRVFPPPMLSSSSAISRIIQKSKLRLGVLGGKKRRPYQKIPKALHKYTCNLCHNTFSSNGNYKKHMMSSHVPHGKFPCSNCCCVFTTYNALNSHMGQRHSLRSKHKGKQVGNVDNYDDEYEDEEEDNINEEDYDAADYDDPSALMEVTYHKPASLQPNKRSNYSTGSLANQGRSQKVSTASLLLNFQKPASQPPPRVKPQTKLMAKFIELIRGNSPVRDEEDDSAYYAANLESKDLESSSSSDRTSTRYNSNNHNIPSSPSSSIRQQKIHKSGQQVCNVCGKIFINYHTLKAHLSVHTGERPHKCDQCDQTFRQKGDIVSHKKTNHVPGGQYACKLCPCRFISVQGYKRHLVVIHSKSSSQNPGSSSSSSSNNHHYGRSLLKAEAPPKIEKQHQPQHNKVTLKFSNTKKTTAPQTRAYKCKLCNAAFNFAQNLTRHQKTSHVPWGDHKCGECSCSFVSATSLRTHEAIFHQIDRRADRKSSSSSSAPKVDKRRPLDFQPTPEASRLPQLMRKGNKKHFLCQLCGATFQSNANCANHIQTSHVENGQFCCRKCPCKFTAFKGLKRHEGIYHNSSSKNMKSQVFSHGAGTSRQKRNRRDVNYEEENDYYGEDNNDDLVPPLGFEEYNEDDIQDDNLEVYIDNAEADEEDDQGMMDGASRDQQLDIYDEALEGEEQDEEYEREKQLESYGRSRNLLTHTNSPGKYQTKQPQQSFGTMYEDEEECLDVRQLMNSTTTEADPLDTSRDSSGGDGNTGVEQYNESQDNNYGEEDPLQMSTASTASTSSHHHLPRLTKREIMESYEEHDLDSDPFTSVTNTVKETTKSIEDSNSGHVFGQRYKILSTQGGGSHVFGGKGPNVNGYQKRINRFIPYKEKEPAIYTCNICFETFNHQSGLRGHMRIHTDRSIQIKFDHN